MTVEIHPQPQNNYRDKILPLLRLPYKRTLFLDTDLELLSYIGYFSDSQKCSSSGMPCTCALERLENRVPEVSLNLIAEFSDSDAAPFRGHGSSLVKVI